MNDHEIGNLFLAAGVLAAAPRLILGLIGLMVGSGHVLLRNLDTLFLPLFIGGCMAFPLGLAIKIFKLDSGGGEIQHREPVVITCPIPNPADQRAA